jgi:YD repeat-containing protein
LLQRITHKSFTVSWQVLSLAMSVLIAAFLLTGTAHCVAVPTSPDGNALSYQNERFGWDEADNHYPITAAASPHAGTAQALAQAQSPSKGNRLLGYLFQKAGIEHPERLDYDPFGRLIARRDEQGKLKQLLHWDDEDQLAALEDEQGSTFFAYDPLGRRSDKWYLPHDPQKISAFARAEQG